MAIFKIVIQCAKCFRKVHKVWPIYGGICDDCLVKNVPKKDALENVCSCLRAKIIELYSRHKRRAVK